MLYINGDKIKENLIISKVNIPFTNKAININLYIDYKKGCEDFVIIKPKIRFKDKEYYICKNNTNIIMDFLLEENFNYVIPVDDIPFSDQLFLEIEFGCEEGIISDINKLGELFIDTKR